MTRSTSPRRFISFTTAVFSCYLVFTLLFTATAAQQCSSRVAACDPSVDYFPFKPEINHLKTAVLNYTNTYVDITVTDDKGVVYEHRLVKCGCPVPNATSPDTQVINIPPSRLYVDDGPSLAFVHRSLAQGDRIIAVGSRSAVYSESITSRITRDMDFGELATRNGTIDVAFISSFGVPDYKNKSVTTPFFVAGETHEATPLARGEWLKIFSLMFDKVETGNQEFAEIEARYNNTKKRAEGAQRRPSVILNYPSTFSARTSWTMPSEKQYITQYLRDANVDYRYMNDGKNTTNSDTLETILEKFKWARYLLLSGQFPARTNTSLESFFLDESKNDTNNGIAINKVLKGLAAVRCGNVWSRTKRIAELGANDFFELGAIRPDLILEDIVRAVHPGVDVSDDTFFSFKHEGTVADIEPCPYNELLGAAPDGMIYVDTEMSVSNLNRFKVEDKLVTDIIPEVSTDERIPKENIDAFFEKPQETNSTVLLLRTMVKDEDSDDVVKDSELIANSVAKALGGTAEVKVMSVRKSEQDITITEASNVLSAGAIAGIVVGAVVAAAILGIVLFYFGTKRGADIVEDDLRDRFWNEHGVRLADDMRNSME